MSTTAAVPVKVSCELCGAVADYAPQLDALLVELAWHRDGRGKEGLPRQSDPRKRNRPTRCNPAPDPWDCPAVPLARAEIGGWPMFRVSAPILPKCLPRADHFGKRIGVERANLLAERERVKFATGSNWTKSYRLPVNVLTVARAVWFAVTPDPDGLLTLLRDCTHLGRKPAHGWGRVSRWRVEPTTDDWSWYATDPETGRLVLMRQLPLCPELPRDLDGWRAGYNAVCPPYWHADRLCEVVEPC